MTTARLIFQHVLLLLCVTLAGSLLLILPFILPQIFSHGINSVAPSLLLFLLAALHVLIAPGVVLYLPLSIWLWHRGYRKPDYWRMAGAVTMAPLIFFISFDFGNDHVTPLFFDREVLVPVVMLLLGGCILGAAHFFLLTRAENRRSALLSEKTA